MEKTVLFREFEERDIDFIFNCKNDDVLNRMIVGEYHPFSYGEAAQWVHGCMGEHEKYKFWAICTNDEEKRIIGWTSIANIDKRTDSADFHGIVIGDSEYRNGFAWIESYLFVFSYVFEYLGLGLLRDSCLLGNKSTMAMNKAMYFVQDGAIRNACYKNDRIYDIAIFSISRCEYNKHLVAGDYDWREIFNRISCFQG